ncbi:hypothetical protein Q4525_18965 [Shimia thalassica]|uniref:hypothetical protein n=1 Tax=Shimia thalassica TaxID=1715693 RepID=UPI001C08941C|nr:hypothetical protein [Shimia thalassica]MBU2942693.1 hypothetical protein [Shimia thalassica]MDO6485815.1 hypothetical protein [Shimia thalassica]MDO6505024.1 hypothetical protein [Shimia thalassica]
MSRYFGIWSSIGEIEQDYETTYTAAAAWVRRGEIPKAYDPVTIEVVRARGFETCRDDLDRWHLNLKRQRLRLRGSDASVQIGQGLPLPVRKIEAQSEAAE